MKRTCAKSQWYNVVITVGICMFSLLCWINFIINIENVVDVTETYNEDNTYTEYVDRIDGFIDCIDSTWYDTIFIKKYLCKIDIIYTYLTTMESSQVVKGKGKWLFYKSSTDGNSIGDYEGTNRYSSSKMSNILDNALMTQEELNSRNIKFAIIVAPNKENIYSEYMPDTYTHADISSTDILIDYLAENGVNIVTPKQELLDYHDEFQLYYSYDTHWNQLGAYIGVKNLLESWNISEPSLKERSISSYNLAENYHYCGEDDLAKIVVMRYFLYNDEIEYEVEGTGIMNWEEFEDEQNNNEVSYFYNPDAQMKAKLLLVGDSFRTSMIPSLREVFSDVYVVTRSAYSIELLEEIGPEYLVAEYVERQSGNIGKISFLVE